MFPQLTEMVVQTKLDDIRREAERDRLASVARETVTAYSDRRGGFRRLFGATGRLRPVVPTPPTLIREPAI
jgi:hypothetical protein